MSNIFFELVTPEGILFSGEIEYMKAPGVEGEFGIYPNHVPFFTLLKEGIIEFKPFQQNYYEYFFLSNGVFEFNENKMTILAEEAFSGRIIDKSDEKKAEKEIIAQIEKTGSEMKLEAKLRRVQLRIRTRELTEKTDRQ
ncbi:MAG: ATP synthase F1 subunit epsilon [Spirochaetes bacterium]|nr:ATP synthase F1 subunit epsilon [Spirochaetota bacterium]